MNFKILFLAVILSGWTNSWAESEASVSIMNGIDRGEDFYVSLSKKVKSFLCGDSNQKMDTSIGRFMKFFLCGINAHERVDGDNTQVKRDSKSLSDATSLPPDLPDFKFVTITPDSFIMGSPKREKGRYSDENQVEVTITSAFEIMRTEVTQLEWFKVMGNNPSYFSKHKYCPNTFEAENDLCPNHPVERVSWDDAQLFIDKLNNRDGLTGCDGTPKSSSGCYRLPTEAEWEFAARGDTSSAYYFGNNASLLNNHAWYLDNSNEQTHAVGEKAPNPFRLYDMHGNVWEWVEDSYTENLPGGPDPLHEDANPTFVIRGGCWLSDALFLRSAIRGGDFFDGGGDNVGFRLVRTL